ncbi:beta-aspartyl-peptidase [Bradyrhizobium sp. URHD0069]|uniref:beta-aspartyl-peptidase n=1 Tax=Bradyrhizobium sp. URHD0069 TaxID=1380355 RepID=UPI000495AB53|nr:beta-aspartyl-peptidase [Bradyrhizobium sp. URHD0069]
MITLLRNCRLYTPKDLGAKDLLIAGHRIAAIADSLPRSDLPGVLEVDCQGKAVAPGFIDSHVHILGGGGSNGPITRGPELNLTEFTTNGTTTVVGLLGADGLTRDLMGLLAKARSLELEGMSAYILVGAYDLPLPSFTGDLKKDIVLVSNALGIGEVAIADMRSSQPTLQEIIRIGADACIAGRLAGRGGIVNVHIGPGKKGIELLFDAVEQSDLPANTYLPTHCNRNSMVLDQMVKWAGLGGPVDLTTIRIIPGFVTCPDAVKYLLAKKVPLERISMSTDGGGVFPHLSDADGKPAMARWETSALHREFKDIVDTGVDLASALHLVSVNPARHLRLYPQKGTIAVGSDADLVVLNEDLTIDKVVAMGKLAVDEGRAIIRGIFE